MHSREALGHLLTPYLHTFAHALRQFRVANVVGGNQGTMMKLVHKDNDQAATVPTTPPWQFKKRSSGLVLSLTLWTSTEKDTDGALQCNETTEGNTNLFRYAVYFWLRCRL